MEELILRNYESFTENPLGVLLVKENSNLMYLRIARKAFVVREFIDNIVSDNDNIKYVICYYDVKNNEKVLTLSLERSLFSGEIKKSNKREDMNIIPLSKILNIKDNERTILSMEDIDNIINFKEEYIPGKKKSII